MVSSMRRSRYSSCRIRTQSLFLMYFLMSSYFSYSQQVLVPCHCMIKCWRKKRTDWWRKSQQSTEDNDLFAHFVCCSAVAVEPLTSRQCEWQGGLWTLSVKYLSFWEFKGTVCRFYAASDGKLTQTHLPILIMSVSPGFAEHAAFTAAF